jgi:hypothetical protein
MNLTSNFDFCIEMGIAQVKEIFHLAFKDEKRYPHNVEPLPIDLSGNLAKVMVQVYDDKDRPADLKFQDEKHIVFSFPFDLKVAIIDTPDPVLSNITLRAKVEIPALLNTWSEGEDVLGLDFTQVTQNDVNILTLEGLPTITIDKFRNAIHRKYDTIPHIYTSGGMTLLLYDGSRDTTISPPNAGIPFEITATLETFNGNEFLKITAPIHVNVPLSTGVNYNSYGRIIFWRSVTRTDTTIAVKIGSEPVEPALASKVELDTVSVNTATELARILTAIHGRYDAISHVYTLAGNILTIYDDTRDPALTPVNVATPFNIEAALEIHGGEYLKVTIPLHIKVPNASYSSYGRVIVWRKVVRTAMTISIIMSNEPADLTLATQIELDTGSPAKALIIAQLKPLIVNAINGFGTIASAAADSITTQLAPMVINAIGNFGTITELAFTDAAARLLLKKQIADYIKQRRFPIYTPESGDPTRPLSTPIGFILVTEGILSILLNRRSGNSADDHVPDDFLGFNQLALAIGRDKVDEFIESAIMTRFPGLKENGSYEIKPPEIEEGSATLKKLNVEPADPGSHDQSVGHLWVTGEAEVHIDCWPDPDVSFSGPVFVKATRENNPDGTCKLEISASAGDFDIGQSCCDVLIDLLIPIVGIIMLIIVENIIDNVGGQLAGDVATGQNDVIQPLPPVVTGIAEVHTCLTGLNITSQGFILPGEFTIRRWGRSFEDMKNSKDLPRP